MGQRVSVLRDLPYHSGAGADALRHRLDLYLPESGTAYPAVVYFHGGDWARGDKDDTEPHGALGRSLAARGVAVAVANYRLSDGTAAGVAHPAHAEDAARATSFVRAFLNARGVAPDRLLLMGHDAGAHLAALVATNPRFLAAHGLSPADLAGVIGLSGVYRIDPYDGSFGDVFGVNPDARRDASPIDHVSAGSPPHLLLVGAADRPGREAQARAMAAALVAQGVQAVAETIAGRDHLGLVGGIGQPGDVVTAWILQFAEGGSLATPTAVPSALPPGTATATPTATPAPVAPPAQPADGPGGRTRPHASALELQPGERFLLLWPDDPVPPVAPVVIFVPDAERAEAESYLSWLVHMARGGAIVIAPRLEGGPADWPLVAADRVREALGALRQAGGPQPAAGAAYAGDGPGALLAAGMGSAWLPERLPPPRAVMMAAPRQVDGLPMGDLRRLPGDALVLVVSGDEEPLPAALERELWAGLAEIPGTWRQFVRVRSDRHGTPALVAGPGMARTDGAGATLDALDWFGTWKWLDALVGCAYLRLDCAYALGDTPEQRAMGYWADGTPVREPVITFDSPRPMLRVARLPFALR